MKIKSLLLTALTSLTVFATTSSSALEIYLANNSLGNIQYFQFPGNFTYGPLARNEQVKLPMEKARNIADQYGEVFFATSTGLRSCGTVNFSKVNVVAFRVNLLRQCHAIVS